MVGDGDRCWRLERSCRELGASSHRSVGKCEAHACLSDVQVDSLLGATLQQSLYSSTRNKIVHSRTRKTDDDVIVNVPGSGFNLLSNNGVNLVSAAATAVGVAWASAK